MALQLSNRLGSSDDLARTFEGARALGFEHVLLIGWGQFSAAELKGAASAAGLGICATQEDAQAVLAEPGKIADRLSELGCRFTAFSSASSPLPTLDAVFALADELSRVGEVLRSRGRLLTYRNHAGDFRKLQGKAILDWVYERSDPVMVHGAIDTYWVQAGGGDPAGYCARLSGRLPLLLLKDYAINAQNEPTEAALSEGNLSFPTILREAHAAACEWYVVGVDEPEAAAASLRYLRSL